MPSSSSSWSVPHSPLPSLTQVHSSGNEAEYYSCILSYATEDEAFAEKLYANLRRYCVPCWFAPHDLRPGDPLRQRMYEAIGKQDKLLLILSEHAVRSGWIESEVEVAFERERQPPKPLILFPIRLDDAVMRATAAWAGEIRRMRFIGDFRQWQHEAAYQRALQRLLRDLHK